MSSTPEQEVIPKAYRWKPQDYLSNHLYKRGKTCFFSSKQEAPDVDAFRRTEFRMNSRMIKDFTRASATPNKTTFERADHSKSNSKNKSMKKTFKI